MVNVASVTPAFIFLLQQWTNKELVTDQLLFPTNLIVLTGFHLFHVYVRRSLIKGCWSIVRLLWLSHAQGFCFLFVGIRWDIHCRAPVQQYSKFWPFKLKSLTATCLLKIKMCCLMWTLYRPCNQIYFLIKTKTQHVLPVMRFDPASNTPSIFPSCIKLQLFFFPWVTIMVELFVCNAVKELTICLTCTASFTFSSSIYVFPNAWMDYSLSMWVSSPTSTEIVNLINWALVGVVLVK